MSSKVGVFITGTDTDIGKTTFAIQLLKDVAARNLKTMVLKPVASGCKRTPAGLRSDDALQLINASTIKPDYDVVNPITFELPISPNIAAELAGKKLTASDIVKQCEPALTTTADSLVVEGCGGWHCPINRNETMADVAKLLNFPVILVVHMKLGCLNHSILTYRSILESGCEFAGWVANTYNVSSSVLQENIETLTDFIGSKPLSIMPSETP